MNWFQFLLNASCFLAILFGPVSAHAQTTPAEYDITLYSGAGLGSGTSSISIFLKYPGAGRSDRIFFSPPVTAYSSTKAKIEISDVLVRKDTLATAIAGEITLDDGRKLYVPIVVGKFERPDRIQFDITPVSNTLNAFRTSYPFNEYSCNARIERDDLEKVILASRTILTESQIYLANDESWNCLNAFFEVNARTLKTVSPQRLNDVMTFLSDYRQFQGADLSENFLKLYLRFIHEMIKQDILGSELGEGVRLKDHLRSELTEIYTKHSDISYLGAGLIFENLSIRTAGDVCLKLAPALFNSLTSTQIESITDDRRGPGSPHDALTLSLVTSMDCAIREARNTQGFSESSRKLGEVGATSAWLVFSHPEYLQSYLNMYDKMEGAGLLTTRDRLISSNSRVNLIYSYYENMFKARPTPRARPGAGG